MGWKAGRCLDKTWTLRFRTKGIDESGLCGFNERSFDHHDERSGKVKIHDRSEKGDQKNLKLVLIC